MGKGRAPCCDKSQVKKGPWSPAEDLKLITFIQKHGHENWRALPKQAGLLRCGKSCRLRWINYLRPDVKRGNFTEDEEDTILRLHETLGNKWSKIASHLPGRTDNEIKNVWNTHLKKKLASKSDVDSKDNESKESSLTSSSSSTNMSSGKRRAETELDEDQWDNHQVPKKPRESGEVNKAAEESEQMMIMKDLSISSCSSDNSVVSNSSQGDGTRPEDQQMDSSVFDFTAQDEDCYQVGISINNFEEVNKPEIISDNELQIPLLESDSDFWNMLDSFGSFQSNEVQLHEVEQPSQSSSFGEPNNNDNNNSNKEAEADSRKWLQYLENELGLESVEDQNSAKMVVASSASASAYVSAEPEPLIPETCEILLKPEVDHGISYFQLWNSSVL